MGRPKKTTAQRRAERFEYLYRIDKARLGLREPDIAAMLDISLPTLKSYRTDPGRMPLGKAVILWTAMDWTAEKIVSVLFPERKTPPGVDTTRRGA